MASEPAAGESGKLDSSAAAYRDEAGQLDADFLGRYTAQWLERYCQGERAIQMGLGNGVIAQQLAPRFREFIVVEGSRELVDAFAPPPNCRVVAALFEDFTPAAPVDRIFGNHVLEHVDDPVAIVRRTRSWLASGGRAIFTVPNAGSLHRRIGVEMGLLKRSNDLNEQDVKLGHRRVYTAAEFRTDIETSGYSVESLTGYLLKIGSNRQMKGWQRDFFDAAYRVSLTLPAELCANLAVVCS